MVRSGGEVIGRDDVLDDLRAWVERSRRGEGRILLVRGEAGIGKTTVVRALVDSAGPGVRVLQGWCDDLLAARPLGPVWDMSAADPDLRAALDAGAPGLVRQRILDALVHRASPTLVVVEDVHWADGATIDLLRLIGRRVDRSRLAIVLTMREVGPRHPVRTLIGDLPAACVENVHLGPWSAEVIAGLAGDREVAERVRRATGGNPYLVTALLDATDPGVPTPSPTSSGAWCRG
ncbi:AAA family ATPase [Agromyces sp. SYSU T0242]|uniref:AAA family ATPase n=1 Tax=Agromyces litoreus TaxID=3158561 RepID=UPI00339213BA